MRTVIIGGGACGASTAARIRRLDESAEIIVLEKTGEISIANCGLPYYTSGVINDREKMLVSSPEKFREWFNINVKLNTEVININPDEKFVETADGEKINYDTMSAKEKEAVAKQTFTFLAPLTNEQSCEADIYFDACLYVK